MTLVIRPVHDSDCAAVHSILMSSHVLAGSMRVPMSRIEQTQDRLTFRAGKTQLVADCDGEIVGFAELLTFPDEPRQHHVGEVNLVATRHDWQGKGVGRALTESLIELADNWLNLTRLGLIVFSDNFHALKLYEHLDFKVEGTMQRIAFGNGRWMDAFVMGRIVDQR